MDNNHEFCYFYQLFDVVVTDVMSLIEPKEIVVNVFAMFCNG